jgi:hypothetical protein
MMERLIPTQMTGTINQTYNEGLVNIVNYITNTKGAYAVVDPHNFGRKSILCKTLRRGGAEVETNVCLIRDSLPL